jgi:hypothetical protein
VESYPVLDPVSQAYPRARGRSPTCYSPVRRSCTPKGLTARLACVKHAASVRPEPGSNSPLNDSTENNTHPNNRTGIALITSTTKTNKHGTNKKFSTLLSSQRTTTHHHEPHCRGPLQGNLFRVYGHTQDVNSHGPHSTAPISQATTRGSSWPTRSGVSASSWLPFGVAEATEQSQWMSMVYAGPGDIMSSPRDDTEAQQSASTVATVDPGGCTTQGTARDVPALVSNSAVQKGASASRAGGDPHLGQCLPPIQLRD